MASSWVMVWIPTKTNLGVSTTNTKQKQRIRLFSSDSDTLSEEPEEEQSPGSIDIPASPVSKISRGDTFTTSADSAFDSAPSSNNQNQKDKPPKFSNIGSIGSEDSGDKIPLTDITRNTYERALTDILSSINVSQAISQKSKDGNFVLVTFCVGNELLEDTIIRLGEKGIGNTVNTSISIIPTSVHVMKTQNKSENNAAKIDRNNNGKEKLGKKRTIDKINQAVDSFYSSVKSRMLVAEVVNQIRAGADFTFDYVALVILASSIAFFGLLENSSVVLVASMLVSPIMGPILAGVFGAVISEKSLLKRGIYLELLSLGGCIIVGFLYGLIFCPWIKHYGLGVQNDDYLWPTDEMISRGNPRSLYVGLLIAIPSGAGVALSVLGGNAGSMVGVAISASLLPPAVNSGLFWADAFIAACQPGKEMDEFLVGRTIKPALANNTELMFYNYHYSKMYSREAFGLGLISLLLTIVNIICIVITGWAILKLKEVTPDKIPQHLSSFWKKDLKVHREYLNTIKDGTSLIDEARQILGTNNSRDNEALENTFIQTIYEKAIADEDMMNIRDWVAKPVPGVPKIKRLSTASMGFGSLEVPDTQKGKRTVSYNEPIKTINNDIEQAVPNFRTRAMSGGEAHGEMLRQRMHAQAKMIIWSKQFSSMGSNGNPTEL